MISIPSSPAFNNKGEITVMYRLTGSSEKAARWASVELDATNQLQWTNAARQLASRLSITSGCAVSLQDIRVSMTLEVTMVNGVVTRIRGLASEQVVVRHKFTIESVEEVNTCLEAGTGSVRVAGLPGYQLYALGVAQATISSEYDVTVFSSKSFEFGWDYKTGTREERFCHTEKFLEKIVSHSMEQDIKYGHAIVAQKDATGYTAKVVAEFLAELHAAETPPAAKPAQKPVLFIKV